MSDYIPEDNLLVIFKHLPVKTLLRFRCVCKDWKQFIDSPTFSQLHLSVQKPRFIFDHHEPNKYVVVDPHPDPLVYDLSKPETKNHLRLFGTLHGVVCLYDFKKFKKHLVLWNPSLRKLWSHPFPSSFKWYGRYNAVSVLTIYGFWIDPSTKEFKAVILQQWPVVPKCIMYSSIRDGWSEIPTGKIGKWNRCREGPPVIVGGAAHWGGCLDESINDSQYHTYHHHHQDNAILSFDFVQESFDIIELPCLLSRPEYSPCHWQGALSVVCWDNHIPRGCEVYSRQEDSWVKIVGLQVYVPYLFCVFWPMEDVEARNKKGNSNKEELIGEKENVKVLATTSRGRGELILHGTKTDCTALMEGLYYDKVVMAYDFVESLLFP